MFGGLGKGSKDLVGEEEKQRRLRVMAREVEERWKEEPVGELEALKVARDIERERVKRGEEGPGKRRKEEIEDVWTMWLVPCVKEGLDKGKTRDVPTRFSIKCHLLPYKGSGPGTISLGEGGDEDTIATHQEYPIPKNLKRVREVWFCLSTTSQKHWDTLRCACLAGKVTACELTNVSGGFRVPVQLRQTTSHSSRNMVAGRLLRGKTADVETEMERRPEIRLCIEYDVTEVPRRVVKLGQQLGAKMKHMGDGWSWKLEKVEEREKPVETKREERDSGELMWETMTKIPAFRKQAPELARECMAQVEEEKVKEEIFADLRENSVTELDGIANSHHGVNDDGGWI